jgi:hypothetical protein
MATYNSYKMGIIRNDALITGQQAYDILKAEGFTTRIPVIVKPLPAKVLTIEKDETYVKVSTNEQLIAALNDPAIVYVELAAGYYEAVDYTAVLKYASYYAKGGQPAPSPYDLYTKLTKYDDTYCICEGWKNQVPNPEYFILYAANKEAPIAYTELLQDTFVLLGLTTVKGVPEWQVINDLNHKQWDGFNRSTILLVDKDAILRQLLKM